jgi:hypothetical protein
MIGLVIHSEPLTALQARATQLGKAGEVAAVGGRAVAGFLRDYLFQLDEERPNKMGGQRTHFFADAARSVQTPQVAGGTATVSINHIGLAQRLLGGTITAGHNISSKTGQLTSLLAVPAQAEAYGKTPGEFSDLEFVPTRKGGMLVQSLQTQIMRGKHKGDWGTTTVGGLVMYWLTPEVTQDADPSVLPGEKAMAGCASDAMTDYLDRNFKTN